VQATRGWDPAELDRREKAQLPLEEKRQRADEVIRNDAGIDALGRAAGEALDRVLTSHGRGGATSGN
jgi:dephospho-CoA kinase